MAFAIVIAGAAGYSFSSRTLSTITITETGPTITTTFTLVQNSASGVVESDVNASSACAEQNSYSSAFAALLSSVQVFPAYVTLEGNRSGYAYDGGGCTLIAPEMLNVQFVYSDTTHPFKVCGNVTDWPHYAIIVGIDLTPTGYDLGAFNFTSVYYAAGNTTISCNPV